MSDEKKYGDKELKLINEVINTYKNIDDTFYITKEDNICLQNDKKRDFAFRVRKQHYDYMIFGLDKILKDNFDEDFVKEKLKRQ